MDWDGSFWEQSPSPVDLETLPGTLLLHPADGGQPVLWANGELPRRIKQAGGASWTWHVEGNEAREILCLARDGARLFVDNKEVIECPAGLPYVPAPHRCPEGSRVTVNPGTGTHEVRLELNSHDPLQDASVILAYPNFHICPWTKAELPDPALLPAPSIPTTA